MNNIFKSLISMLVCLIMMMPSNSVVFASNVTPYSDTSHYFIMKNKVSIGNTEEIQQYVTSIWAKSDNYTVTSQRSISVGLSVAATTAPFSLSGVKATGEFNALYSVTLGVQTSIPANSTRFSKLVIKTGFHNYRGDLYYVTDWGYNTTESYHGSGTVKEPWTVFYDIIYQ